MREEGREQRIVTLSSHLSIPSLSLDSLLMCKYCFECFHIHRRVLGRGEEWVCSLSQMRRI